MLAWSLVLGVSSTLRPAFVFDVVTTPTPIDSRIGTVDTNSTAALLSGGEAVGVVEMVSRYVLAPILEWLFWCLSPLFATLLIQLQNDRTFQYVPNRSGIRTLIVGMSVSMRQIVTRFGFELVACGHA